MEQLYYASFAETIGGALAIALIFIILGVSLFLFKTVNIFLWKLFANRKTKFPSKAVNNEMYITDEASYMPLTVILIVMFILGLLLAIFKVPVPDLLGRVLLFGPVILLLFMLVAKTALSTMSDNEHSKIERRHKLRLTKIENISKSIESDKKNNNLKIYRHLWRAQYYLDCISYSIINSKRSSLFQYIESIKKDINYLDNISDDNSVIMTKNKNLKENLKRILGIDIKEQIKILKSSKKSDAEKNNSVNQLVKFGEYSVPYLESLTDKDINAKTWADNALASINKSKY